jgi:hypothetical protein
MALNLTMKQKYKYDGSEVQNIDATQTCNEDAAGMWGSPNPDRADRCLISWAKFTDQASSESYLEHKDQFAGTFKEMAIAPGAGLINTDQSVFTILSTSDGHHTFYALAIEQFDNLNIPGSPVEGDVYYNTDTTSVMIYTDAWYVLSDTEYFVYLEANTSKSECNILVITRLLIEKDIMTHDWEACVKAVNCDADAKFADLQYLRTRLEGATGDFYSGKEPTARKTVYQLTNKFIH